MDSYQKYQQRWATVLEPSKTVLDLGLESAGRKCREKGNELKLNQRNDYPIFEDFVKNEIATAK